MEWSEAKERVFSFGSSMAVSAGAGSGKTAALVELYLRLLAGETRLGGVEVPAIAAITFTDKAATEMKERIRGGIRRRMDAAGGEQWDRALRELPQAAICTFHSFCATLLREHPVEAAIDPASALLDEAQAKRELQEAGEEILREEIRAGADGLRLLLRHFTLSSLEQLLPQLQRKWRVTGRDLSWYRTRSAAWDERARSSFPSDLLRLRELSAEVGRILGAKPLQFHASLARYPALAESPLSCDDPAAGRLLAALAYCITGQWGKEKPVRDALLASLESLRLSWAQLQGAPVLPALLDLLEKTAGRYRERKERCGALDFDDLLILCRDLLQRTPAVREEWRSRLRVVMVDEFQDTNLLQKELVALLCGPEQRLFIVGDPKQSIYLFRGADVEVFLQARREIQETGGELLCFRESFRSRPGIVHFVNRLFAGIMDGAHGEFDLCYGEDDLLEAKRRDGGEPCVELLEEGEEGEAAAVARRIASLLCAEAGVRVGEEQRSPRAGDIAILLRRFSNVKLFERELRKAGIPYYVVKGKGLYQCREVVDLLCFLRCLEHGGDLVALAAVLRSPLCDVSDETLLLLSRGPGGLRVWDRHRENPAIDSADRERLERLSLLLQRLRPLKDRLTLPELLEEIVTSTGFCSILLTTFQGEQKVANVRKLIEHSRSSAAGEAGLRSFIRRLQRLVDEEPTEGEAVVSAEGGEVVRIMTVHQSKGLEFPVVFIPEMGAPPPVDTSAVAWDDSLGIGLRLSLPGAAAEPTLAQREIGRLRRSKEKAELKRLLYVAVTRARDYLVLSGKGRGDWRRWIDSFAAGEGKELLAVAPPAPSPEPAAAGSAPAPFPITPEIARRVFSPAPPPSLITFTTTGLAALRECPRKFFYREVLGLDEGTFAELSTRGPGGKKGSGPGALERGILAHAMLERIDFSSPASAADRCTETARFRGYDPAEVGEVTAAVASFASSAEAAALAAKSLRREYPFLLSLQGDSLYHVRGTMDLLAVEEERVAVYDYKFTRGREGKLEAYRFQLLTYMLALKKAFPSSCVEGVLVFLKEGETERVDFHDRFERELLELLDGARSLTREEEFPMREGCAGSCPFRGRCGAGSLPA